MMSYKLSEKGMVKRERCVFILSFVIATKETKGLGRNDIQPISADSFIGLFHYCSFNYLLGFDGNYVVKVCGVAW